MFLFRLEFKTAIQRNAKDFITFLFEDHEVFDDDDD